MNIFKTEPSLPNILKELNSESLTLEQKFLLFMLPDRDLFPFRDLKEKKRSELKKIETEFGSDLDNFKNDQNQSFQVISEAIQQLQTLNFTDNIIFKNKLLGKLKAELNKDQLDYTDDTIHNIEILLNQISGLQPTNCITANGMREITILQNKYHLDLSFNSQTISLNQCQEIIKAENDKQKNLFTIRNELCTYKYALSSSSCFNEELLFTAAFIDPLLLENTAPKIYSILHKRKKLYKKIKQYIDTSDYDILQFAHPLFSIIEVNDLRLLYSRLRKLIHAYFFLIKNSPSVPCIYPKVEDHLNLIRTISSETELLTPEINYQYKNNFAKMLDQLDITQKDVAKILGISDSALSQEMNKDNPSQKYLLKLAKLYNCSLSFLQEKTTIPSYGKLTNDKSAKYLLYITARRNVGNNFLDILHDVFTQNREDTYSLYKIDPSTAPTNSDEKERFDAVIKHIAYLQKEYKKLPVEKIEALTSLLKK
ncbi:MAG: helix-turn-helix transcriptional regulator [Phycisphaerales bacterium]